MMNTIILLSLLLVPLARLPFAAAENQPCCVCFDNCKSTITIPNAIVPLPEDVGIEQATCAQILDVAEVQQLVPPDYCSLLNREDFRSVVRTVYSGSCAIKSFVPVILTQFCFFLRENTVRPVVAKIVCSPTRRFRRPWSLQWRLPACP